jgi:hypothetical protein
MIVVKVELHPHGSARHSKEIGRAFIWNTGEGSIDSGTYEAEIHGKGPRIRSGQVKGFSRLKLGPWELLARALKEAGIQ